VYAQVEAALLAARDQNGWELDIAWWQITESGASGALAAVGFILGHVVGEYFDMLGTSGRGPRERYVLGREAEKFAAGWYTMDGDGFERVVGGLLSGDEDSVLETFDGAALLVVAAALLKNGVGEEALVRARSEALGEALT
jgi:hypothetical protein